MAAMYADLVAQLKRGSCWFVRSGKGSHEIWFSPITGRNFTVPRSLNHAPLANEILKQAGLPKAF